jgi:hypothetical protein
MLRNIDYMHWKWKNYPFSWQEMYKGHKKGCTVILEEVATHDLWVWHSFFGMPGSNNDINVLQCSLIFSKLVEGHASPVDFVINGQHYNKGYYLANGIYPKWATFVKTISSPVLPKEVEFVKAQEGCRKDIERAFGVLQQRFGYSPVRRYELVQRSDVGGDELLCVLTQHDY